MINKENIIAHELNGLKVKAIKSCDKNKEGMRGKVIKETKNTLVIEEKEGEEKILPKKEADLEFLVGGKKISVEGRNLVGKPEERIKLFFRRKKNG
ncbi:ribonuclease P protein subunit [Candidatus Micrarchaeota archaeon]|nr:ribonuclease P protein subunit [Candidatus Micrarchaeota archaeon]